MLPPCRTTQLACLWLFCGWRCSLTLEPRYLSPPDSLPQLILGGGVTGGWAADFPLLRSASPLWLSPLLSCFNSWPSFFPAVEEAAALGCNGAGVPGFLESVYPSRSEYTSRTVINRPPLSPVKLALVNSTNLFRYDVIYNYSLQ